MNKEIKNNNHQFYYMTIFAKAILSFLFIFVLWACLAPINSYIIAAGKIIVSSEKKIIQHLEGGIIEEIKINEGDFVDKNQELIILDNKKIKVQIKQTQESIKSLILQKNSNIELLKTLKHELNVVNQLFKSRSVSLEKKLNLEKQISGTKAKLGEIKANIAQYISENTVNQDILTRTIIRAPVSGYVMDLKKHTIGGVIAPGGEVMYIVPKNDNLLVEVKVNPKDIDLLHKSMLAKVQLSAFNGRLVPKINGKVLAISADSFSNEMTGEVYFKSRIEILQSELTKLKNQLELTPGMPAEAFIVTGSRTLFSYLITPIRESSYKAFREE